MTFLVILYLTYFYMLFGFMFSSWVHVMDSEAKQDTPSYISRAVMWPISLIGYFLLFLMWLLPRH